MVVLRDVEAPMAWPRSDQLLVMKAKMKKNKKKHSWPSRVTHLLCNT